MVALKHALCSCKRSSRKFYCFKSCATSILVRPSLIQKCRRQSSRRLKQAIASDPTLLDRLEDIVHPLVAKDRARFLRHHATAPLVLLDIPLLFEAGADAWLDAVLVVTTDPDTQRARVMARPGMTEALFSEILSRQVPDAEKQARADHVIETQTLDLTRAEVARLIGVLTDQGGD